MLRKKVDLDGLGKPQVAYSRDADFVFWHGIRQVSTIYLLCKSIICAFWSLSTLFLALPKWTAWSKEKKWIRYIGEQQKFRPFFEAAQSNRPCMNIHCILQYRYILSILRSEQRSHRSAYANAEAELRLPCSRESRLHLFSWQCKNDLVSFRR